MNHFPPEAYDPLFPPESLVTCIESALHIISFTPHRRPASWADITSAIPDSTTPSPPLRRRLSLPPPPPPPSVVGSDTGVVGADNAFVEPGAWRDRRCSGR